jgi:FtsH-binding integral membrane protein
MHRQIFLVIGYGLLGIGGLCFVAIVLIATFEGDGARGMDLVRGGLGGHIIPVTFIPFLIALAGVLVLWLRRRSRESGKGKRFTNDA